MNISEKHNNSAVSTYSLFERNDVKIIAIQIKADEKLKEHITKTPAVLICVSGKTLYQDENGMSTSMSSGDFIEISPFVKHWVVGVATSQLLLIK